jgi:hypothetical protein
MCDCGDFRRRPGPPKSGFFFCPGAQVYQSCAECRKSPIYGLFNPNGYKIELSEQKPGLADSRTISPEGRSLHKVARHLGVSDEEAYRVVALALGR